VGGLRKLPPSYSIHGAARHQPRGWALEQKRHVPHLDDNETPTTIKGLIDSGGIGETANPWDARANTAYEYCTRQR